MSFHSHNRYRQAISFRWDLPRIDPAWVVLLGSIRDVRAAAGQEGVEKFIAEWRKRGYLECSDEDAKRLATTAKVTTTAKVDGCDDISHRQEKP